TDYNTQFSVHFYSIAPKSTSLNEGINYLKVNPNLLRSPIIIEKDKVLIGYNPEQIRMFLPQAYRRKSLVENTRYPA
uniref:ArsC/Spx/MgsR family protein n=1 Tax=Lactococcus petauri TaxID=1940789 RepID=UPI0022E273AC